VIVCLLIMMWLLLLQNIVQRDSAERRDVRGIRRAWRRSDDAMLERHLVRQTRLRDAYDFICTCELSDARTWALACDRRHARDGDALLEAIERQTKMMEQEMYIRPEGWLTVAHPLVKIHCALGNAVAVRKWAVCAEST
jgi:hypothetical protein